jgi:Fanconi anemia group M protein
VEDICRHLLSKGFRVSKLIGKSGEGGQTQSKQIETLRELRGGVFNILVATQIGEEGLDIAECNRVIFYDNVSSAVRFIQRRGRTGRREQGNVTILVTKGTQDEAYYWMSKKRLSSTIQTAEKLEQSNLSGPMDKFVGSHEVKLPVVYADARETHDIAENLRQHGARVEVKLLEIGDFVLSDEIVIERKNIDDFVKSIFDGRLFSQIIAMKEVYPKPILIVQGTDKRSLTVGAQSFYGALASIVGDFQVPVFTSKDSQETAELIFHLARREQIDKKREVRIREGRKPMTTRELQKYVVAGVPGISTVLADRLLSKLRSPEGVFTAAEDSLKSVEGIGEKLARRIRELASVPYI